MQQVVKLILKLKQLLTLNIGLMTVVKSGLCSKTPTVVQRHLLLRKMKAENSERDKLHFTMENFSETAIIYQAGEELLDITVHVSQKGMLETVLADYDYAKIESLTITGELGELDFYLIRNQLPQLRNLDISATNVNVIPSQALINSQIEKCILPKGLTTIREKKRFIIAF